jgi:hypothetical protein
VILDFQINHFVTVEMLDPSLWRVKAKSEDNIFSGEVVLDVKLPALDIRAAALRVSRDVLGLVPDLSVAEEKLIGVRVGQGMTKIVRALVGGARGSDRMAELVLEGMEMLINALTVPELRKAMETAGDPFTNEPQAHRVCLTDVVIGEGAARVMAANPRLKDSCVAFKGL